MFALVKFTDESRRICLMKNVTVRKGTNCIVKYSGGKYEAELLASNETRERLQEIEETIDSGKLLANEKQKQSYQKPKIIKVEKVLPKKVREYCEKYGSSASKTKELSDIALCITDSKIELNKNVFQEHPLVVETTDQNSLSDVTRMVIEESDVTTNSENSIDEIPAVSNIESNCNGLQDILIGTHANTFSLDCNRNSKTKNSSTEQTYLIGSDYNLQNTTYNTHLNDSEALLLGALDQRNLDITPYDYLSNSSLTAANTLFPSAELLSSTPETFQDHGNANFTDCESNENILKSTNTPVTQENRCSEDSDTNDSNDIERHDPSYKPRDDTESDLTSDTENATDLVRSQSLNEKSTNNSCDVSDKINISVAKNIPGSSRCNDDDLCIEKSRGRNGDQKYNFCIYCHKKQKKIARHLELKHSDEADVQKFLAVPKNSIERRKIIAVIRKKGNFLFNTQTEYNDGELIVSRRPNPKFDRSGRDFAACAGCKAFYSKSSLRMHAAKCTGRSSKKHRTVMIMSKRVVARIHSRATDTVINEIFPPLREDDVVRSIRYDELIIIYANNMGDKYDQARNYEMVRQSLRLLGRFLLTMRRLNKEITDLSSVYDPKFCDDTVKAIIIESKLTQSSKNNVTPAVASHLGTLLKKIGSILINECIKKHDDLKKKHTKDFVKLLTEELSLSINRRVVESQTQIKRRKKIQLPSTEDIKKLCLYLEAERKKAFQKLQQNFSEAAWMQLAETTLTSIQLFNRRRAGEIERTLIEDFNSYQTLDVNTEKDLFNSLSKENQALAKKYVRFAIRGKLNRTVSVLLNNHLLQCIELLLSHKKNMKISYQNPYVFGLPGVIESRYKHLRACTLLRKFSSKCGATHPERLRGTKLRKHIATICISLNLTDNEVTDLANYMGHAEKIHKDIYRQPLVNREILKMSKLLEVAQGANTELNDEDDDTDLEDEELKAELHDSEGDDVKSSQDDMIRNHQENSLGSEGLNSTKLKRSGIGKRFSSPYGTTKRTPWTDQEKTKVFEIFGEHLRNNKLPSLKTIHEAILENPCLKNRTSPQIKTWLHNQTRGKKRKLYEDD